MERHVESLGSWQMPQGLGEKAWESRRPGVKPFFQTTLAAELWWSALPTTSLASQARSPVVTCGRLSLPWPKYRARSSHEPLGLVLIPVNPSQGGGPHPISLNFLSPSPLPSQPRSASRTDLGEGRCGQVKPTRVKESPILLLLWNQGIPPSD